MTTSDCQEQLIACIRRADRPGGVALLDGWAAEHGQDRLFATVLNPVLERIGEAWRQHAGYSLAQLFVAAKITEAVLARVAQAHGESATTAGMLARGTVVIGNIEEDFHALGRRLLGTFLRADGWIVHDLGCDVPAAQFIDRAEETGAQVVGVSAMTMTSALLVRGVRHEIDRRGLAGRIRLAVGGAVFRLCPGLAEEVGGDGTAASVLEASALCGRLQRQVQAAMAAP